MKDINATIIINLKGKSEEELYKAVEYSRRKNIQKAIRSGITYEESKNLDHGGTYLRSFKRGWNSRL